MTSIISIDKHCQIPLYSQIKDSIRTAIRDGKLAPGDKLPTEEEICRTFDISRPVVRQAYAELSAERIIERRRGQGSYVRQLDADNIKLFQLLNFYEEMKILGKKPENQLIKTEIIPYDPFIYDALELTKDDRCLMIMRVRYADNLPFALIHNYVSLSRFPGIEHFDFAHESLYRIIEEQYNTKIYKACRTMQAQIIAPFAADLLRVKKNTAASVVTSQVYDNYDKPIEISVEIFPGETHKFNFTVYRD